jgi:hypothetical protein
MLRFTIRDLLWLTVVAAMALGWWREHQKLQGVREAIGPRTPGNGNIWEAANR